MLLLSQGNRVRIICFFIRIEKSLFRTFYPPYWFFWLVSWSACLWLAWSESCFANYLSWSQFLQWQLLFNCFSWANMLSLPGSTASIHKHLKTTCRSTSMFNSLFWQQKCQHSITASVCRKISEPVFLSELVTHFIIVVAGSGFSLLIFMWLQVDSPALVRSITIVGVIPWILE